MKKSNTYSSGSHISLRKSCDSAEIDEHMLEKKKLDAVAAINSYVRCLTPMSLVLAGEMLRDKRNKNLFDESISCAAGIAAVAVSSV